MQDHNDFWQNLSANEIQNAFNESALSGSLDIVYGTGSLGASGTGSLAFLGQSHSSWFLGLGGGLTTISPINFGMDQWH